MKRNPQFLEPQTISIENGTIVNTIGNCKLYKKSIDDIQKVSKFLKKKGLI